MHLAVPHLDNQYAPLGQVVGRLRQHAPDQIQAIFATGQPHGRFMAVFFRHVGEILGVHIGRIGNDQVEPLPRQTGEASPCTV